MRGGRRGVGAVRRETACSHRQACKPMPRYPAASVPTEVPAVNEDETRRLLIDPALAVAGWDDESLERELIITVGRRFLVGDEVLRRDGQRADYVLLHNGARVAVLEAKDDNH